MQHPRNIVISGAGLVGSLWAYTLKKRGYNVRLFEKRSDMRKEGAEFGRSINLIVTSRGINALKQVGLEEDVLKITVPVTGRMMHSLEGELAYQPYGRDDSECNYSISRSQLNALLMDKAEREGVEIIFDSGLEALDLEKKKARFREKEEVSWDLFFGCDGAASATRKAFVDSGVARDHTEWLGVDYKELFAPAKEGQYVLEKKALHIWPRGCHMFMALPNLDGSFTMTLYMPDQGDISFEKLETEEHVLNYFREYYGDSVSLMPGFEKDFFQNPQGRLGTVRCSKWHYRGVAALLGDAAHAIVPFFGQGMNCGFEDIFYLTNLLDKFGDNWDKTLEKYDRLQRPNGNAIADMAVENFTEMAEKVGSDQFLLRKKVESKIEKVFSSKYRSRYGMVTYTLIPYVYAQEAGRIQDEILNQLCSTIQSVEEVDFEKAENLIEKKFIPFIKERKISLERFTTLKNQNFNPTTLSFLNPYR